MKVSNKNFWKGRNVLITGVNGFIGGNLAKALIQNHANVFGIVRNHKPNTFLEYENLSNSVTLIQGDLCNKNAIEQIISEEEVEFIFHLAAQVEVGIGAINPYITFETNVRGTYTLLEAARKFPEKIKSIVVASTDKAYGSYPPEAMPYKEDYPLLPQYPYDTSKAAADLIAQSYASDLYKLPIVVTRFCNIYGPGQLNFSAVVPDAITSAQGYSTFIPRGDGTQVRDFIYVEDVVSLYLMISRHLENNGSIIGEIYNAGSNKPISVRALVEKIFLKLNKEKDLEIIIQAMKGRATSGEIDTQFMDFEKVNKRFGWKPRVTLEEGLDKTIEWFDAYNRLRFLD